MSTYTHAEQRGFIAVPRDKQGWSPNPTQLHRLSR